MANAPAPTDPVWPGARRRNTSRSPEPPVRWFVVTSSSSSDASLTVVAPEAANISCAWRVLRALSASTWRSRASKIPSLMRSPM